MIDIDLLRKNPKTVQKAVKAKGVALNINDVLKVDAEYRELLRSVEELQSRANQAAKEKNIEEGKKLKEDVKNKTSKLRLLKTKRQELLFQIPNLPATDVKEGKNESENEIVKTVGKPPEFNFTPKDHLSIGEKLDIIDVKRAANVSGTRFSYLKNEGVLLEFALIQLALKTLMKEGFAPIIPPALIKSTVMKKLGYMEGEGAEDMFHLEKDSLTLIGTAEHSIVPYHMGETLRKEDLPKRYVGFSSSFRREAGSYGKDVRGIFRVHQFDKVEMVSFVSEEDDTKEHEHLLSLEEKLFQLLKLPYQVVKMCTGDLGFPTARKYDIEAWIPSQNKYREVTSASTTTDFQSRRLDIKYQEGKDKKYVHILNGTAFSTNRPIIAILENYQNEDGSVLIPEALQQYTGFSTIG